MKTKLTLEQLKSADFLEIIEKDELESLVGAGGLNPSCVFNCFDHLDGNLYSWEHYANGTQSYLGYGAGSGGEVNTSDIPTIGSFGTMAVTDVTDNFRPGPNGSVNGAPSGIMCFIDDNGNGHAVVITGVGQLDDGTYSVAYCDPSHDNEPGIRTHNSWYAIYSVGGIGTIESPICGSY